MPLAYGVIAGVFWTFLLAWLAITAIIVFRNWNREGGQQRAGRPWLRRGDAVPVRADASADQATDDRQRRQDKAA